MQSEGRDARGHGGAFWASEGRNGEARKRVRGEKVREGAKCWVMKDLASHDMDLDGILSVMGRQKSAVSVWRVTGEADTH